jgi:hypothetical protein
MFMAMESIARVLPKISDGVCFGAIARRQALFSGALFSGAFSWATSVFPPVVLVLVFFLMGDLSSLAQARGASAQARGAYAAKTLDNSGLKPQGQPQAQPSSKLSSKPPSNTEALLGEQPSGGAFSSVGNTISSSTLRSVERPADLSLRGERRIDELTFSVGQESFLNRFNPTAGATEYTQVGMRFRAKAESRPLSGTIDIGGSFATNVENYTMFEVPEAYLNWVSQSDTRSARKNNRPDFFASNHLEVVVGRRRQSWSLLDSEWMAGLTQPLHRFDALRPLEQGLTGVFLGWGREKFEVVGYTSSVYIPEQGAPFELENGRFTSRSPWFQPPPDKLVLFDQMTAVEYRLQIPAIGSIIKHPSLGLILRYGSLESPGIFAQASFAKKPRNTLSMPFKGQLFLTDTTNYGDVSVYPKVAYHNVGAIDLGWRDPQFSIGLSGLTEVVDKEEVPEDLTYQINEPLTLISPSIEYHFLAAKSWGPRVRLSYLRSYGGAVRSEGSLGSNGNVFGPRTPFSNAAGLSWRSLLVNKAAWKLEHGLRWIEEFGEQGTVVMADFRFLFGDAWRFVLSGDVLGSRRPVDQNDSFIARFRGNDRVSGRVTYVF